MLTPQQIAQFNRDGFLKGSRVLDDAAVEALRTEIGRVIEDRERADRPQPVLCHNMSRDANSTIWQIVNIWQASEPFAQLIRHPIVCEELAQLMGAGELRIWHDQIQYKPAGKGGVNMWHQDSPYWGILKPKDAQVTAWVALDDVDAGNGCMSMVPGSHKWGNQIDYVQSFKSFDAVPPTWNGHDVQIVLAPVRKGEVHYHHSLTWHGSHANTSDRPRRAVALHYMTEQTRYDESGNHVMKPLVSADVRDGQPLRGEAFPLVWERTFSGAHVRSRQILFI